MVKISCSTEPMGTGISVTVQKISCGLVKARWAGTGEEACSLGFLLTDRRLYIQLLHPGRLCGLKRFCLSKDTLRPELWDFPHDFIALTFTKAQRKPPM